MKDFLFEFYFYKTKSKSLKIYDFLTDFIPKILENYQMEDGRVKIPDVLVPYFGSSYINKN